MFYVHGTQRQSTYEVQRYMWRQLYKRDLESHTPEVQQSLFRVMWLRYEQRKYPYVRNLEIILEDSSSSDSSSSEEDSGVGHVHKKPRVDPLNIAFSQERTRKSMSSSSVRASRSRSRDTRATSQPAPATPARRSGDMGPPRTPMTTTLAEPIFSVFSDDFVHDMNGPYVIFATCDNRNKEQKIESLTAVSLKILRATPEEMDKLDVTTQKGTKFIKRLKNELATLKCGKDTEKLEAFLSSRDAAHSDVPGVPYLAKTCARDANFIHQAVLHFCKVKPSRLDEDDVKEFCASLIEKTHEKRRKKKKESDKDDEDKDDEDKDDEDKDDEDNDGDLGDGDGMTGRGTINSER
jgi:hypothetical protein